LLDIILLALFLGGLDTLDPFTFLLEAISKIVDTLKGKVQADEKAQHTCTMWAF
jgi:hypothetical protein